MTSLQKTIESFQEYVLRKKEETPSQIAGSVDHRLSRMGVYREAYLVRLIEVLSLSFPGLLKLLGESFFESLCEDYLDAFPSHSFTVRHVGHHLASFLRDQGVSYQKRLSADFSQWEEIPFSRYFVLENPQDREAILGHVFPVCSEMAAFERLLENTLEASDAPHITIEELKGIDPSRWEDLQFTVHPSVTIAYFSYDVPQCWQHMFMEGSQPQLDPQPIPKAWLIWRYDRRNHFLSITAHQLAMLQMVQAGENFSEVCGMLLERNLPEEEVIPLVAQTLHTWVGYGLFSSFRT